jgi:hypothetical protein
MFIPGDLGFRRGAYRAATFVNLSIQTPDSFFSKFALYDG